MFYTVFKNECSQIKNNVLEYLSLGIFLLLYNIFFLLFKYMIFANTNITYITKAIPTYYNYLLINKKC